MRFRRHFARAIAARWRLHASLRARTGRRERSIPRQPVDQGGAGRNHGDADAHGTIVTRRPVDGVMQQGVAAPVVVETVPNTIDAITTREVLQRREATEASRLATREVAATPTKTTVKRTATKQKTRTVARPQLALNPQDRQIVYRTIVEREVVPARPVVVPQTYATQQVVVPGAPVQATVAQAPIVAADDDEPVYRVGAALPANVPPLCDPAERRARRARDAGVQLRLARRPRLRR